MLLKLRSKLKSMRAKVPMYRLFLKIFLWFWSTALGILLLIWLGFFFAGVKEVTSPNMYATVAPILAAEAIHAYESGGPQEFARFSQSNIEDPERHLYLLDGFYRDVLSRSVTDEGIRTARAAKIGQLIVLRGHIAAYKLISPAGRPYVLVLYIRSGLGELRYFLFGRGLPFAISMFLLVTLFSFWLAYHIASPIYSIQSAARRVAEGDLKARVPFPVSQRHDELASLAKDFDSMVDRLEALIGAQRNLLNSVSHELRSPLARVNLCVALLKKDCVADNDDTFQRLERDVSRIDLLMGQLLTLSRLEAGLSFGERTDVDLSRLVEEVVADGDFEAQVLGKSVSLHSVGPVIVSNADPHALRSALENIIRNAVRFTPPGTDVQVVLETHDGPPGMLASLSVRDHGPGVPEESLQSIFQPFVRIDREDDTAGGNGLGLAIASQAIRIHRGTLTAAKLEPAGLEITVHLPLKHDGAVYEVATAEHSRTSRRGFLSIVD